MTYVYCRELHTQCCWAVEAYQAIIKLMEDKSGSAEAVHKQAHWMLVCAGNASKLLGLSSGATGSKTVNAPAGQPNRAQQARSSLQEQLDKQRLNLNQLTCLRDRKFRNHLEHFDERLDKHVANSSGGMVVDNNVCIGRPLNQSIKTVTSQATNLRNIEIVNGNCAFTFLGDRLSLTKLADELARVEKATAACLPV